MTTLSIQQLELLAANNMANEEQLQQLKELKTPAEQPVEPAVAPVEEGDTNTQPIVQDAANDQPEAPLEGDKQDVEGANSLKDDKAESTDTVEDEKSNNQEQLQALMDAKLHVRSQLLPEFEEEQVSDFHLVASVAESFAENRVHTVAYEVPTALQKQFNNTNAYLSFKSIITDDLSSREVKAEQAKKNWATVCTNYTIQSTGKFRTTGADKQLKIGSQIITYSTALEYEHNPDNFLGLVDVKFKVESLEGKKKEIDAWLDIDIDEARMQQKRWYLIHKDSILESLDDMDQYKPARLTKEKFERYKLLLAIAKAWGEDHFNNVKAVIDNLALSSGKTENEKFAEALKKAICDLQSNFVTPLENLPSDSLIEQLKENKFPCSRQTLPTYLNDIAIEASARHQISFFGNTVQGYKLSVLEQALQPFEVSEEAA